MIQSSSRRVTLEVLEAVRQARRAQFVPSRWRPNRKATRLGAQINPVSLRLN